MSRAALSFFVLLYALLFVSQTPAEAIPFFGREATRSAEMNEYGEASTAPFTSEEPVATLQPVSQEPVAEETPCDTTAPGFTDAPTVTDEPLTTEEPLATDFPTDFPMETPVVGPVPLESTPVDFPTTETLGTGPAGGAELSESPEYSEEPELSESPEYSEEPELSESPEYSEEPELSESPEYSEPELSDSPDFDFDMEITANPMLEDNEFPMVTPMFEDTPFPAASPSPISTETESVDDLMPLMGGPGSGSFEEDFSMDLPEATPEYSSTPREPMMYSKRPMGPQKQQCSITKMSGNTAMRCCEERFKCSDPECAGSRACENPDMCYCRKQICKKVYVYYSYKAPSELDSNCARDLIY